MPLSNEEQRTLEELEASLLAEDPRLAHTMGSPRTPKRTHGRRAGLAGLGFLLGVCLLLIGMQTIWVLSVLGFVVMFGCAILALGSWRRMSHKPKERVRSPKTAPRPSTDFMTKMESRWRRREDDGRR